MRDGLILRQRLSLLSYRSKPGVFPGLPEIGSEEKNTESDIGKTYVYVTHLHMCNIYICDTLSYTEPMQMGHEAINQEDIMRTVSIFKNGNNRAIRLPRDLDFEGVSELEIAREGDSIILRPVRPTWGSFAQLDKADPDFMAERADVVSDEGRFDL